MILSLLIHIVIITGIIVYGSIYEEKPETIVIEAVEQKEVEE